MVEANGPTVVVDEAVVGDCDLARGEDAGEESALGRGLENRLGGSGEESVQGVAPVPAVQKYALQK
jgi:hypothetical protein